MPITDLRLQSPKKNGYIGYLSFSTGFASLGVTISRSIHVTGIISLFVAE